MSDADSAAESSLASPRIDVALVRGLIKTQFPQWADLPVWPVASSGWDNRTFHLGETMSVRLPSAAHYAGAVAKEQRWLPWLARALAPLVAYQIPVPVAQGAPAADYPWPWSVYRWLDGATATRDNIADMTQFACDLAGFLCALQTLDTADGPVRTLRGGSLQRYDAQVHEALERLDKQIDGAHARHIWQEALAEPFDEKPVWYHGDVAAGNLLISEGRLSAVIDFGGLGVGDPACDLCIAWTFLEPISRAAFRAAVNPSDAIWNRGRGWALWKALIVVAGLIETNEIEAGSAGYALEQVLQTH